MIQELRHPTSRRSGSSLIPSEEWSDGGLPTSLQSRFTAYNAALDGIALVILQDTALASTQAIHTGTLTATSADQVAFLVNQIFQYAARFCDTPTKAAVDEGVDWMRLVYSAVEDLSIRQVGEIVEALSKDMLDSNFPRIDKWLSNAEMERMSLDAVIAVSRTTYSARDRLSNWKKFVEEARLEMVKRGEPAPHLQGL